MFNKILIANRGEIAARIIRTCRRMGVKTVAVFSEADVRSRYVAEADESAFIGPAPAKQSFLNSEKIIDTAVRHGCQAVHPGYGFFSENAGFAERAQRAGLVFIGPSPAAIAQLGDKVAAKALARRIGMPVVPGYEGSLEDPEVIRRAISGIGYPLLLKPAAGGGGRGMRIVHSEEELAPALETCREETRKSFGDDRIFIERYIVKPRHIEFQVFADSFGNIVHLGERECSVQRRFQKVIEETPSLFLNAELRRAMGSLACALAREAGYTNAGTVEFIMDGQRNFYFLEMNTRLQVEHPVTELVTALDLVELQLRVAAGEPLPLKQQDVFNGWAIEARICAEDQHRNFMPTTGMVTHYAEPGGEHVRVDSGIEAGSVVTVHYDSLLSKVSVWGETRKQAIVTLINALNGYYIAGLVTNIDFVNAVLNHPEFTAGNISTDFIPDHFAHGESAAAPDPELLRHMVLVAALVYHNRHALAIESLKPMSPLTGGTHLEKGECRYLVKAGTDEFDVSLSAEPSSANRVVTVNGVQHQVVAPQYEYSRRQLDLTIDGTHQNFRFQYQQNHIKVHYCGLIRTCEIYNPREWALNRFMARDKKIVLENVLRCPMPSLIIQVCVQPGDKVFRGQTLFRLESMKMEINIESPCDGYVDTVPAKAGQNAESNEIMLTFRKEE